jgi:hypothetical protein
MAVDAQAAMRFSVFGAGLYSSQSYSSLSSGGTGASDPYSSRTGWGVGAEAELGLGSHWGLELGVLYLNRELSDTSVTPSLDSSFRYLEVPLQLRYWLGRTVSIGAGAYAAYAIGDIEDSSGGSTAYSAAGYGKFDAGLLASLGLHLPVGEKLSFFLEGRYSQGLSDLIDHSAADASNPALADTRVHWSELELLIGLQFGAAGQ